MKDKNFERALAIAAKTVESWPKWKQGIFIVCQWATNPTPRKPVPLVAEKGNDA